MAVAGVAAARPPPSRGAGLAAVWASPAARTPTLPAHVVTLPAVPARTGAHAAAPVAAGRAGGGAGQTRVAWRTLALA